jgi:hypothetical protein
MGTAIAVGAESLTKELGLRKATSESINISRANSVKGDVGEPLWKCNELQEADKHDEDEGLVETSSRRHHRAERILSLGKYIN